MQREPSRPYASVNSGSSARLRIWLCASMISVSLPGIEGRGVESYPAGPNVPGSVATDVAVP
jgi:hypothetical protein